MIGGETGVVKVLVPISAALAPGIGDVPNTAGRQNSTSRTASRLIALWRIIRGRKSQIGPNSQ